MSARLSLRRQVRRTLAGGLALALALAAFVSVAVMVVPIYDMQLYDRVLQSRNMDTLAALSVACAAGLAMYAGLEYLRSACFVAIGEAMGRHLSGPALEEGVRRAAAGDRRAGTELVRDLNEIQGFLASGAMAGPLDALCAPLLIGVLFMMHPAFGWLAVCGVAGLTLSGLLAEWRVRPALEAAQERRTAAQTMLARSFNEPDVADGLGMLPAIGRRWALLHGEALDQLNRSGATALLLAGLARLVRIGMQAAVMGVGALLVLAGATTPGSLMGVNLLMGRALGPFDQIVGNWRQWTLAHAAWRRIERLLSEERRTAPDGLAGGAPGLSVHGASVRSGAGRWLLRDIGFRVEPGTLVLVAGPNGAGKTTLLRLLAGLAEADEGVALLDGLPVRGDGRTGYLPQSVSLLEGTTGENIARFRGGALDGAVTAARAAGVHESIGRMARGYDTLLAGNGAALSGGMRQRIGLARALFGEPRLLLLDEPDASLDADGGEALLRAVRRCCEGGAIVMMTSHRPAMRAMADRVLELRGGQLVGDAAAAEPGGPCLATA